MCLAGCARSLVIAAGLMACGMTAVADARTHRFAASQEVTITFTLATAKTHGPLVRFVRNRLAVSRSRSGVLRLRGRGVRTLRIARSAHHLLRVRMTLSALRGKLDLIADRRALSRAGRFVSEDGLFVRSRAGLRSLRIKPRRSVPPESAGDPGGTRPDPSPAPEPASSPSTPAPLFARDSVWNTPVAAAAPLDPASAVLVKKLSDTIRDGFADGRAAWIQTTNGSTPLYIAPPGAPTVRVTLDAGAWATSLQQAFAAVPIPANAAPAAGTDGHMTVWQPSTDRLWEFFKARKLADGWHASFGGAISAVSLFPGYYSDSSWPGLSQSYWGATATSLPVIAGTMLLRELEAGVIPHAVALNIPYARPKVYSWPAQRTDGTSTDAGAIPEGAHFRLDPTLDLTELNLPPMTRMMAEAAQRYGMIVRDQTNWAVALFAEDPSPTGASPFGGSTGFYGGRLPSDLMKAFPWDRLQLLEMDLHGG